MAGQEDRLARLGRLFAYLLDAELPRTRAQIEDELPFYAGGESGRKRFEEDKRALLRAGIPLETVPLADGFGYRIDRAGYRMPELDLLDPELAALDLAATAVGFQGVSWAQLASAKLDVPGLRPTMLTELPGIEILPTVDDAVLTRTRVRFHYKGEDRRVDPWGVVFKHGRWYLVGLDHLRGAQRCYRLDRVVGDVELDGEPAAFDRPAELDLAAAVPDDPILMGDGDTRIARVRVDRRIAGLLPGEVVVDDGAEVEIELQLTYEPAFLVWVLGWGELAEVLAPPDLRAAVIDRLRELAR